MPFVYHFSPKSMSSQKYDECIARLAAAGAGAPAGRLHHACYGSPSELRVFDIWDSSESFDEFGKTLVPILQELGIDAGTPEVSEIHKIIAGS
jgi:hypothetical protein